MSAAGGLTPITGVSLQKRTLCFLSIMISHKNICKANLEKKKTYKKLLAALTITR